MTRSAFAIVVLFLLGVTGCAGVAEPLGMEDPFAIPQPFRGVARNDAMLEQAIEVPALVVQAPEGLQPELAEGLRDRVIAIAQKRDVPALKEPTPLAWVLRGQAATVTSGDDPGGEQTVISWRLADNTGIEHAQFPVSFQGNEASLSEGGLQLLAEQTGVGLEKALRRPGTQVAGDDAASERPVAWIGSIKGAPGDGNLALARALQAVLPLKGVRVEAAKNNAQWRVEGLVKVAKRSATEDVVTLAWRVIDAKGKEVGTIRQENAVAHGRLAKTWGEIAGFAAEAAAEGIAQLLQQVGAPKNT
jgi:hypothetical protein